KINLLAALLNAATTLIFAKLGHGVWALIYGGLVLFGTRAVGLTLATKWLIPPSFRFKGAGRIFQFGSALVLAQFFWFLQSQSDIFIAGRLLAPHELGLYTTALFLTQALAHKFVPPLNEVAFAAYSRMQGQRDALGQAFLKGVRLVMLVTLPFYLGLAATAEPLVLTVLGEKWAESARLVQIVALSMPFFTLQILFAPANNGAGRAGTALKSALAGAVIMPACFLIGIQYGILGLALGCLVGFPILAAVTALISLPGIGVSAGALSRALMPGLLSSALMMLSVMAIGELLPQMVPQARLSILVVSGAALYAMLLFLFARPLLKEALALMRRPTPAAESA
ncbi:MAG TPA: oligosaccharide flippase family protein, partial [Allosphingosinicella sp.]|nr:oligosaccharide flippase family protein [Allosphingosinicella sp.]